MNNKIKKFSVLSLIFGIIAFILSFVIIGVVFSIIGISIEVYCIKKHLINKSVIVGLLLNVIALVVSIIMIIAFKGRYNQLVEEFWNGFNQSQTFTFVTGLL